MLIKTKTPKQGNLFAQKNKQPEVDVSHVYNDINEIGRRLRVLEQRYSTLQNKAQITEQNIVSKNRQLSNEIKTTDLDIHEIKREIAQLKDQLLVVIKELKSTAKKEEVKVLERYLNFWEPVKFVTHDEFEDMVMDLLERLGYKEKLSK